LGIEMEAGGWVLTIGFKVHPAIAFDLVKLIWPTQSSLKSGKS
jgi:hypothetical protein